MSIRIPSAQRRKGSMARAVKFDSDGQLHVLDTVPALFTKSKTAKHSVAELSPGLDNFVIDEQGAFVTASLMGLLSESTR